MIEGVGRELGRDGLSKKNDKLGDGRSVDEEGAGKRRRGGKIEVWVLIKCQQLMTEKADCCCAGRLSRISLMCLLHEVTIS